MSTEQERRNLAYWVLSHTGEIVLSSSSRNVASESLIFHLAPGLGQYLDNLIAAYADEVMRV